MFDKKTLYLNALWNGDLGDLKPEVKKKSFLNINLKYKINIKLKKHF